MHTQQEQSSQQEQLHSPVHIQQEQLQQSNFDGEEGIDNDTTNDLTMMSNVIGKENKEEGILRKKDASGRVTGSQLNPRSKNKLQQLDQLE